MLRRPHWTSSVFHAPPFVKGNRGEPMANKVSCFCTRPWPAVPPSRTTSAPARRSNFKRPSARAPRSRWRRSSTTAAWRSTRPTVASGVIHSRRGPLPMIRDWSGKSACAGPHLTAPSSPPRRIRQVAVCGSIPRLGPYSSRQHRCNRRCVVTWLRTRTSLPAPTS